MSSGFVSEGALEEARQKRQEEWERVRKPDQPKEAPEEEYDHRSLFERLEENRKSKQAEWDAEHDIKKVVRGIDDDEAAFLDKVDEVKSRHDLQRRKEEKSEIDDYRKMKDRLLEEEEAKRLQNEMVTAKQTMRSGSDPKKQKNLLGGIVIKKRNHIASTDNSKSQDQEQQPAEKKSKISALVSDYGGGSSSEDEYTWNQINLVIYCLKWYSVYF